MLVGPSASISTTFSCLMTVIVAVVCNQVAWVDAGEEDKKGWLDREKERLKQKYGMADEWKKLRFSV